MLRKLLLTALLLGASNATAQAQWRTTALEAVSAQTPAPQDRSVPRAEFRIAHDPWWGKDKIWDHAALAFVLTLAVDAATHAESGAAETRILLWGAAAYGAWEIKDGAYAWGPTGMRKLLGGDGASYKDWIWSMAGVGLALLVH